MRVCASSNPCVNAAAHSILSLPPAGSISSATRIAQACQSALGVPLASRWAMYARICAAWYQRAASASSSAFLVAASAAIRCCSASAAAAVAFSASDLAFSSASAFPHQDSS